VDRTGDPILTDAVFHMPYTSYSV